MGFMEAFETLITGRKRKYLILSIMLGVMASGCSFISQDSWLRKPAKMGNLPFFGNKGGEESAYGYGYGQGGASMRKRPIGNPPPVNSMQGMAAEGMPDGSGYPAPPSYGYNGGMTADPPVMPSPPMMQSQAMPYGAAPPMSYGGNGGMNGPMEDPSFAWEYAGREASQRNTGAMGREAAGKVSSFKDAGGGDMEGYGVSQDVQDSLRNSVEDFDLKQEMGGSYNPFSFNKRVEVEFIPMAAAVKKEDGEYPYLGDVPQKPERFNEVLEMEKTGQELEQTRDAIIEKRDGIHIPSALPGQVKPPTGKQDNPLEKETDTGSSIPVKPSSSKEPFFHQR